MANRIILGNRSGTYGLFISKPGVNVEVASSGDLLLSTLAKSIQIVASGFIPDPGSPSTIDVAIPDHGINPFVLFTCQKYLVTIEHLSTGLIRFRTTGIYSLLSGPALDGVIRYSVTSIEI